MMRWVVFAILLATTWAGGAAAQVSISIGQPGFYGRIDIGPLAPPPVIYAQPLVIQPGPVAVAPPPIYLHVPPGHAKNWRTHCHRYQACGQPVYFVQERWYQEVYVPQYRTRNTARDTDRDAGHGRGHREGHCPPGHAKKGWC